MSQIPSDASWLLSSRDYDHYVRDYDRNSAQLRDDDLDLYQMGAIYALLALRRYENALALASEYHRNAERLPEHRSNPGRGLVEIGACEWMLGQGPQAIATWRRLCAGLLSGRFAFARDVLGGVESAILLWFAAIAATDSVAEDEARALLSKRFRHACKLDAANLWPAPIAAFVLNGGDARGLLSKTSRRPKALRWIPFRREYERRRRCVALFVLGTTERKLRNEHAAVDLFRRACSIRATNTEITWYLSRFEAARGG